MFSATVRGRHDGQLLGDEHDAVGDSLARRVEAHRLAVQRAAARHRAVMTPATIFPSVDLPAPFSPTRAWIGPRLDREADRLQGAHAAEGLTDVPQLDVRALRRRPGDDPRTAPRGGLFGHCQPGHSAVNWLTFAFVTTPLLGNPATGSMPPLSFPVRSAWTSACTASRPSLLAPALRRRTRRRTRRPPGRPRSHRSRRE